MGRDLRQEQYERDQRAERRQEERRIASEKDRAEIERTVRDAIRTGIDRAR
jgi:hypothetical protein